MNARAYNGLVLPTDWSVGFGGFEREPIRALLFVLNCAFSVRMRVLNSHLPSGHWRKQSCGGFVGVFDIVTCCVKTGGSSRVVCRFVDRYAVGNVKRERERGL